MGRHPRNRGLIAGWYKKFPSSPKYPYRFCDSTSQLPGVLFPGKMRPRREPDILPHRELRLIMCRIIENLPSYAYTACTGTDFNVHHKPLIHIWIHYYFKPGKANIKDEIFFHSFCHEETTLKSGLQLRCF